MTADPVVNRDAARFIPVARPTLGPAEEEAVREVVRSGWISQGSKCEEFERLIAEAHGARFGVACNSGTCALHLSLAALGVGRGHQVVIPTLTMVACANAVLYCEATPIFVDSDPADGNPAVELVERIDWRRVKAVISPALYGVPATDFANAVDSDIPIVHDLAEAHYATERFGGKTRNIVNDSDLGAFSFYANKIIATGEGGMVICNSESTADRLRRIRAHAFTPGQHFQHSELAFGYRMTEMQAAIGVVQHGRRHEFLARRTVIANLYRTLLSDQTAVSFLSHPTGSVDWVMPMLAKSREARDTIRASLAAAGVETRSFFIPLHRQAHLRRYATDEYPVADDLAARGFYCPLYPDLSSEEVELICDVIRRCQAVR